MEIKVLGVVSELLLEMDSDEQIYNTVRNALDQNKELCFSHLIVDGEELFIEDFDHLKLNSESKLIEIVFNERTQLIKDLTKSADEYITGAIPIIEELAGDFYRSPKPGSWSQLTDLLDSFDWLNKMMISFSEMDLGSNINVDELNQSIFLQMEELHKAITNQDHVLVGDLLKYEIVELLSNIQVTVKNISEEVNKR